MKQNFDRTNPDEADEYFMNCIREGNLKNAMTCFDPEGVYMDKDGNAISGLANINCLRVKASHSIFQITLPNAIHKVFICLIWVCPVKILFHIFFCLMM